LAGRGSLPTADLAGTIDRENGGRRADLGPRYDGFLGSESVRGAEGVGIMASYWRGGNKRVRASVLESRLFLN